jgi:hypothetical protein
MTRPARRRRRGATAGARPRSRGRTPGVRRRRRGGAAAATQRAPRPSTTAAVAASATRAAARQTATGITASAAATAPTCATTTRGVRPRPRRRRRRRAAGRTTTARAALSLLCDLSPFCLLLPPCVCCPLLWCSFPAVSMLLGHAARARPAVLLLLLPCPLVVSSLSLSFLLLLLAAARCLFLSAVLPVYAAALCRASCASTHAGSAHSYMQRAQGDYGRRRAVLPPEPRPGARRRLRGQRRRPGGVRLHYPFKRRGPASGRGSGVERMDRGARHQCDRTPWPGHGGGLRAVLVGGVHGGPLLRLAQGR